MPLQGSTESSYETELWQRRIKVIMNDYNNFIENELPYLDIPGKYSKYLKTITKDLYHKIKASLDSLDTQGLSSEVELILCGATKARLFYVWHTVFDLAKNSADTPKDLYFFMDSIYERLGGEEVPYFIKLTLTDVPGTLDICRCIRAFLLNLREAFGYMADKKAYVIFATPSLIKNPIDWALLIHEAAHILEEEQLKIVKNYYPQLAAEPYLEGHNLGASSSLSVEEAEPNWALEIACDIISTISCGPIFGYRLLDNFLQKEKSLYETHPPIKKRLELISNELEKCGWTEEANDIRTKTRRVPMPAGIENAVLPEHCNEIINNIRVKTEEKGIVYNCTLDLREQINTLGERLSKLKPCITVKGKYVDLKDLLNASEHVRDELAETQEFKDFMSDMIRLITARDMYVRYQSTSANKPS